MDATTPEDLLVRLVSIPDEGLDLDLKVSPELLMEVLGTNEPLQGQGPLRIIAHLHLVDDIVHVRGRLQGALTTDCARCNDPITLGVSPKFEFACFPEGSEPHAQKDGEVAEEDMEVSTYRDDTIDLSQMLRDEIFLSLPMYPDCTHSVSGRCPDYDDKLKVDPVPEEDEPGGTLFHALKGLKLNKPD